MESEKIQKKGGKPKIDPSLKKKSCNILLSQRERADLEHIAAAYGLNKSAFISQFIKRFSPLIFQYVYAPKGLSKEEHMIIRLFSDRLDITPTAEQAENFTKWNPRTSYTGKAKSINNQIRRDLKKAEEKQQMLEDRIDGLKQQVQMLEDEVLDKDKEISSLHHRHMQSLDNAEKVIKSLERKLKKK